MKLSTLAILAAVVIPTAALADSSQPNSAPGLEGRPATTQGEGTTGMNRQAYPATSGSGAMMQRNGGATDAGKTGYGGTSGASDSSIPGATNPNEPRR